MSCPLNQEALEKLKQFIILCKSKPDILYDSTLSFFKEYIESLGGVIPAMSAKVDSEDHKAEGPKVDEVVSEESDLELDNEGCIEPDTIEDVEMGDITKELSDDDIEKAQELKSQALAAFSSGEFEKAVPIFSQAIAIDASSAVLFTKRGQAYLKLLKPNACIRDCSKALELNPDSAAAYKFRGRAYRLIGEWEKAAKDLRQACKIDFDEQIDEWLKEVTPNAKKIEQHNLKKTRRNLEKAEKEKLEKIYKVKENRAKAAEANQNRTGGPSIPADMYFKLLQDPEFLDAFQDPEVVKAVEDINNNPSNVLKYQSNPKIAAILAKLQKKIVSLFPEEMPSGMPGGFPGGMPGFPGAGMFNAAPPQEGPPAFEDDNLD